MGADVNDNLRALARDHLEGRLSLASYRKLRAQLLDDLLAPGCAPASDTSESRTVTEFEVTTQPRTARLQAGASAPPGPTAAGARRARVGRMAWLAALLALILAAIAVLVWFEMRTRAPQPPAAAMSSRHGADPIRALLRPLLEEPHWSDARLVAVNEALLEAGPARIAAERDSGWFHAVVDSVRNRLRQQQALAPTALTPETSPLAALAKTLGIGRRARQRPPRARKHE